jgi:ATP-dependent RNA helicase DeaD
MKPQAFSELDLPAPLAQAIAARGYERATAVQAAVAGDEHAGRDLLVSSETGSGKTLAFGIVLAEGLLGEPAPRDHRPAAPRALVVTPTRELATQVRNELAWLFARTPVRIGVFTGGTDVRGDLAQLRPGVDLVVGTPGRLVDLLGRRSLRLEAVRTVVLDEADEMLDMGFREDLETLLAARANAGATGAPDGAAGSDVQGADRCRTLMFSATLPEPILALAARYQHDAVRIDARTRAAGVGAGHQDITYVAHLVAMGDKLPALVNVLRRHRGVRAIVFGTTRDGVGELHQQLVKRGFRAVVLSGDRAQAERTRALSALRDGEADLLVATNVAARGLDLPEVDLVVHADLPLNAEALTHRSGRTGRAGRKGTSVLLATLAERRKAERLLSNARVSFTWTAAPGARDITRAAEAELAAALVEAAGRSDEPEAGDARELAARLAETTGPGARDALLVALLRRELERLPAGEPLSEVDLRPRAAPKGGPRPSRGDFSRASVLFEVNLGASQKAEPGWLLPLICRRGGVTRREVGAIRVGPQSSRFEIAGEAADDFALAAAQPDPRAPHVRIQRLDAPGSAGARHEAHGPAGARHRDAPVPTGARHGAHGPGSRRDVHAQAGARQAHGTAGARREAHASAGARREAHASAGARHESAAPRGKPHRPKADVSAGRGVWRPPARQPQPGPRKAGSRRPPRHR